jgi:hypothetical protein
MNCDNLAATSQPKTIEDGLLYAGLCPIGLTELDAAAIKNALAYANGNRTHAAKSLGISVRTLQRKLKHGLTEVTLVNGDGDIFLTSFQGLQVKCRTVEDAVAIKTADALLRDGDSATACELQRLATILLRYDCPDGADKLSQQANRQRAAEFLTRTVGYERPR